MQKTLISTVTEGIRLAYWRYKFGEENIRIGKITFKALIF